MRFSDESSLADVLTFIKQQTAGPDGRPIAIYVDPVGVYEPERGSSTVSMNVEGVPLKTTLGLALKQHEWIYRVRDGVLVITAEYSDEPFPADEDPFLMVGGSWLALFAAWLGGVLAPLLADRSLV